MRRLLRMARIKGLKSFAALRAASVSGLNGHDVTRDPRQPRAALTASATHSADAGTTWENSFPNSSSPVNGIPGRLHLRQNLSSH
jgi:hypothetical protein